MTSVRDEVYELLRSHRMTTVFGNPGSTELPFLAGLPHDFRYVLGLNEGVAVGMADGFAQASGRPVLVNLHSAPGVATAMGALVNAAAGRVPLVLTAGQQARGLLAMEALLTNPDPLTLPKPLVKFSCEPARPQDVPAVLARAIAVAGQPPCGPVFVSLPMDDWAAEADPGALRSGYRRLTTAQAPLPHAVCAVADRLSAARNPVLLVGAGVDSEAAWHAAVALAERCALPVYWAPLEPRCGFPTTHPAYQGTLPASPTGLRKALQGHDFVLAAGTAVFRYYLDESGPVLPEGAELVMLTADPDQAARAPVGDAVVGDVALALRWLADAVPRTHRPAPIVGPPPVVTSSGDLSAASAYAALASVLPREAVVVAESPSSLRSCQDQVRFNRPGSFFSPAGASLGFSVPAAVGMQLARPDRPVVAVAGDGALQYMAPAMWSAVRHNLAVTVLVMANGGYGVLRELRDQWALSNVAGLDLTGLDCLALARAYGMPARRVSTQAELTQALRHGFRCRQPNLIEVLITGHATPLW